MEPEAEPEVAGDESGLFGNAGMVLMVLVGIYAALAQRHLNANGLAVAVAVPVLSAILTMLWRKASPEEPAAVVEEEVKSPKKELKAPKKEAKSDSEEELDLIWEADWTDPEARQQVVKQLSESEVPRPVEVFELSDTPTWLARLQHRRVQAQRSGKLKLVHKLDKEIEHAMKTVSVPDPGAHVRLAAGKEAAEVPEDDIWSMDWSALRPEAVPVAVA